MDHHDAEPSQLPAIVGPSLQAMGAGQLERLRHLAARVVDAHPAAGAVTIILADDELVGRLNGSYRGRPEATDVLSFDLRPGPGRQPAGEVDGEVYISVDRARAQSDEQGVPLVQEVGRLLTHGLLHLAGCDHPTPEDLQRMERETDRLLQEAGLLAILP